MWVAAIDPQWPPIIAAIATLATALGLNERRRRQRVRERNGRESEGDVDRRAAETILTQWKAVLEAAQSSREWEVQERQRCEERLSLASQRRDELAEKVKQWEWEIARRDWLDERRDRRKRKPVDRA